MATLVDIDGEDAGTTPWEWDSFDVTPSGVFALDAGAAKHGSYGYKASFSGDGGDAAGFKGFTEAADLYWRFYMEIDAWAGVDNDTVDAIRLTDGGTSNIVGLLRLYRTATAGKIGYKFYITAGMTEILSRDNNDLLTIGQTHCIEIHFVSHATTGGAAVYIDGALDASSFVTDTSAALPDGLGLGPYAGTLVTDDVFYFDDIKVATTGPIGVISSSAAVVQAMNRRRRG